MPKRNPSGPKRGRSGSPSRSHPPGKSTSNKSEYRPDKKSASDKRPFRRSKDSGISHKKDEFSDSSTQGKFLDKARRRGKDAGYRAYKGTGRPDFKKRKGAVDEEGSRRPHKKFVSKQSGITRVFTKEEKRQPREKRGASTEGANRDRPYKKFDSRNKPGVWRQAGSTP